MGPVLRALRGRLPWIFGGPVRTALTLLIAATGLAVAVQILTRPSIATVMHIEAQTRALTYQVSQLAAARINFSEPVFVRADAESSGACSTGVLAPLETVEVGYQLIQQGVLEITLSHPDREDQPTGRFIQSGGRDIALGPGARLFAGAVPNCESAGALVLPVWGDTTLGETHRFQPAAPTNAPPAPILLEGRIDLFIVAGRAVPGQPARLFPADSYLLPAGAEVNGAQGANGAAAVMRGLAIYTPISDPAALPALEVSLTTEADALRLRRWGSDLDAELIELGPLAALFGDPRHILRSALIAFTLVFLAAAAGVAQTVIEATDLSLELKHHRALNAARTSDKKTKTNPVDPAPETSDEAPSAQKEDHDDPPPPDRA